MGKQWVRGAAKQEPVTQQAPPAKRKVNVWTRDSSDKSQAVRPVQNSQAESCQASASTSHLSASRASIDTQRASSNAADLGESAKRRRLAAKGRLVEEAGSQAVHSSQHGPRAAGERLSEDAKGLDKRQREEKEKREQLQEEADTLRKRIAAEEHKVLVAKVGFARLNSSSLQTSIVSS